MRVLALEPHNDDLALFACFSLCRYLDDGSDVKVVTCLRSDVQNSESYPGGPISYETRERESVQAHIALGIPWFAQWEHLDSDPDWAKVTRDLWRLQNEHLPDVVLAPAIEVTGHDQHNEIGSLAGIVFGLSRVQSYLTYTRDHGRSKGREVEYEPGWVVRKYQALASFESQIRCPATRHWFIDDPIREYQP